MTPARGALSLSVALVGPALWGQTIASRTETTPYPGVRVVVGRTASPAADFRAAIVNLCTNYVHVTATRSPTGFVRTSTWAGGAGVQVAVNGDFFTSGPRVYGNALGGGMAWPVRQTGNDPAVASEWYYRRYGWIGFGPGRVEFSHTEHVKQRAAALGVVDGWMPRTVTTALPPGLTALVSGFPELVTEGTQVTCTSPTTSSCFPDRTDMRARHPRTAMGLSRDRRTLYLVVVDGRTTRSAGMYGTELARLMQLLGAWQAFNLDGGGSSTFWQRGRGVINTPSGSERAVANHWGVFAGSASGRPSAPGSCYTPPVDAGVDAGPRDTGVRDTGVDVPRDVGRDVVSDLGRDVGADLGALLDRAMVEDVQALDDVGSEDGGSAEDGGEAEDVPEFVDAPREPEPDDPDGGEVDAGDEATPPPGCACRAAGAPRGGRGWGLGGLLVGALVLGRRRRRG